MKDINFPRAFALAVVLMLAAATRVGASENVPHAPFAQWADLPARGQLVVGAVYQESEAYHFWAGDERHRVDFRKDGEHYGIDINQGYLTFQYGLTEKWAADLAIGYTTTGWRNFSNFSTNGSPQSTTGLMDIALGVRYKIFDEDQESWWRPTLTFRAGAVLPGSYDKDFPFAPGSRSVAIEPEFLARKQFGWPGLGVYADGLFRWNRTTANDQYIVSAGLFQKIQRWELNAGYRHLGTVTGENIVYDEATRQITYSRSIRENNDSFEAGFSYTSPKRHLRTGFYSRTVFNGVNTDKKFWIGGFVEIPFSVVKAD